MSFNKKLSICLNYAVGVLSFLGVILALFFARRDGYNPWYTRLWYFTQQSNVWIGVTCIIWAVLLCAKTDREHIKYCVNVLKFIFTVSITLTGIIFCVLLAPFADFDVWTFSSVLTHVVVPIFSIADFFIQSDQPALKKTHVFLTLAPAFLYFIFAGTLCILKVDFGRGDPYPYFFFNFYSEVGLFGFKGGDLPQLGSFYWLLFMLAFILIVGFLYYRLHPATRKKKKSERTHI